MKNGNISRRNLLGLSLTAVATACSTPNSTSVLGKAQTQVNSKRPLSETNQTVFQHGVASGDPMTDSVVLWSRVTLDEPEVEVDWQISAHSDFRDAINAGTLKTNAQRDYTVKVIADGLQAGQSYYYRFKANGVYSVTGRTKTLPTGKLDKLGIALASCSNYPFGYFNAYDAIAKDAAIDVVLHTGDYIYEYGAKGWGGEVAKLIGRQHLPAHEIISLSDYRTRHAQYKSDSGSQAMHAAHPMICCWDDHESANNPWLGGAQNHQQDEGQWQTRRDASIKAYYEWMPIREIGDLKQFSRTYQFADLATLATIETRHTARAQQIDYKQHVQNINSLQDAQDFKRNVVGKSDRKMLSEQGEQQLMNALKHSKQAGQPWRLIGNPCPIARMLVPDVEQLGVLDNATQEQRQSDSGKALAWKGKYNLPFYTDTWDGYPWARQRLYQMCQQSGVEDLLFLTGDSHSFWMNRLSDDNNKPMGLEIGTAGITSPGDFVESGWDTDTAYKLDRVFESQLDEVVWTDNFHQGYVRVELERKQAVSSFVAVDTVLSRNYMASVIKQTVIKRQGNSIDYTS